MKYMYYLALAVALPTLLFIYTLALGYTPWASAFLTLPPETEILLFTIQAGAGAATIGHFIGYQKGKNTKKLSYLLQPVKKRNGKHSASNTLSYL